MMWSQWLEILSVFLLSTIKFVFGSMPMALSFGFSFFQTVTITSLGGFTGCIIFVIMSEKIIAGVKKRKEKKLLNKQPLSSKKIFTRKNKIIVSVKVRFGIIGIALLTPLLLSIPIGCFLAVRYFKNKQEILMYMFGSILFWSTSSYYLYKPVIAFIKQLL